MPTVQDVADMMAENIGERYVELITFEAKGEPTGYLAVNDVDVTSRGRIYHAASVDFNPAKQTGQELSKANIVISNVTRELIDELRKAHEEPTITAELVALSRPDDVVEKNGPYEVHGATFTNNAIKIQLEATRIFDERFPSAQYLPSTTPGVFA